MGGGGGGGRKARNRPQDNSLFPAGARQDQISKKGDAVHQRVMDFLCGKVRVVDDQRMSDGFPRARRDGPQIDGLVVACG